MKSANKKPDKTGAGKKVSAKGKSSSSAAKTVKPQSKAKKTGK